MEFLQGLLDGFWLFVEKALGWRPDEGTKNILEWASAIFGVAGGLWWLIGLFRGGGAATRDDVEAARKAMAAEIAALKAQFQRAMGPEPALAGAGGDSGAKDLDAGIETLLRAGREDALRDKTGEAAQNALDDLIAKRASARERIAHDEAALYRQKGAFAFLHDTQAAMRAYAKAAELDPDDPEGWNRLGQLQLRTGDLNAAEASFGKVLALGNSLKDKSWEAAATGIWG